MTAPGRTAVSPYPKVLLVEGATELRVIPWLMEANGVQWPSDRALAPVQIREKGGITTLLQRRVIETELDEPNRQVTGILVDADSNAVSTIERIKEICHFRLPEVRNAQAGKPCILSTTQGRFGFFVLPDNKSPGMLETMLLSMIAIDANDRLLDFAKLASKTAHREHGAPFRETHGDKASLHTWLAWQDEPGAQVHEAVKRGWISAQTPAALEFVRWFRELFDV